MATVPLRVILLCLVFGFAGVPILFLLYGSVHAETDGGFTLAYLERVFLSGVYKNALINTLTLATAVGFTASAIGITLAWIIARWNPPGRVWLEVVVMTPIFMSPFIGAIGWITLGQPRVGVLNVIFAHLGLGQIDVFSYFGAVLIMATYFSPYAYALVRHSIGRLNPEMEEAAAVAGAGRFTIMRKVTIPLLWPSIISAMIFTFILAAEMFSIPGILLVPRGYDFLSYSIYISTVRWPLDHSEAAAIGVLLLLITLLGIALYSWVVRIQERFIALGPKAPRVPEGIPGWLRYLGLAIICTYLLATVILPIAGIVLRALLPFFSGRFSVSDFSLNNLRAVLGDQLVLRALKNSVIVTVCSISILIVIAFFVALGKVRRRDLLSSATALMAAVPIAVPGVLFGVGLLWTYIRTPIYATIGIIIMVMLARFLPLLVRLFETALIQIGRELEEAAAVSGASELVITWKIRLPLLLGTLRSAIAVGGAQVFNELTASALLFTAASSTLPVVVFNYMFDGDYSRAAALALIQISVLVTGFALISLLSVRRRKSVIIEPTLVLEAKGAN
ncbi:MAG: iron ABC transporter permease [Salinarimonadaceae bacterium]|nr:MAG: iron ABC transporter permease [Salinarimonadaceae bacterium]